MKVSTVKPEFQPVVITLETQEEVDQMFQMASLNGFENVKSGITLKLFTELENMVSGDKFSSSGDGYITHTKEN